MREQHEGSSSAVNLLLRSLFSLVILNGVVPPQAGAQVESSVARAGDRVRLELTVGRDLAAVSAVGVLQSADSLQVVLVTDRGETQRVHLGTIQRALRLRSAGVCTSATGRVACTLFGTGVGIAVGYSVCRFMESCYIRDDTGNGMKIIVGVGGILGGAVSFFFGRGSWEDARIVPIPGR